MTVVEVLGRVDELADGTGGTADAVRGDGNRSISEIPVKDNQRIDVPVTKDAVEAAVANVEWAVARILARDFPMRPHPKKCLACDFKALYVPPPRQPATQGVS